MKQLFLYRLFKHSKIGFVFIAAFLVFYAVGFYKKMDMIFFPFNNMYAIDFTNKSEASTYALKINDARINITHNLYWKKDLLETSLFAYCHFLQQGNNVFLNSYIPYRFKNKALRDYLIRRLTPGTLNVSEWPAWYAHTAGYDMPPKSTLTFMEYHFIIMHNMAVLKDSTLIFKTTLP